MEDPWGKTESNQTKTLESSCDTPAPTFDDDFSPPHQPLNQPSFQPLSDSESYLANLERKLEKLKAKSGKNSSAEKRDLLLSLAGTREGHIDRLLTSGSTEGTLIDSEIDSSIENSLANTVIRHVAPHLQAVSAGELVQLLQADQLSRETEELTDSATSSSSETLPSSR